MPEIPFEDPDEIEWDLTRVDLEDAVILATLALCEFMGCNQYSLKEGDQIICVKVNPCDV